MIREGLSDDLDFEIILAIIERFKLNEEILSVALPILCKKVCQPVDERVKSLLTFYSSPEKNGNLRFILLSGLAAFEAEKKRLLIFQEIPQCILNLLLDDEEEIRNEICAILCDDAAPLNPAATLRKFIGSIEVSDFAGFLDNYEEIIKNDVMPPGNSKKQAATLFEKEPLNLFIDIQYLRKKFLTQ